MFRLLRTCELSRTFLSHNLCTHSKKNSKKRDPFWCHRKVLSRFHHRRDARSHLSSSLRWHEWQKCSVIHRKRFKRFPMFSLRARFSALNLEVLFISIKSVIQKHLSPDKTRHLHRDNRVLWYREETGTHPRGKQSQLSGESQPPLRDASLKPWRFSRLKSNLELERRFQQGMAHTHPCMKRNTSSC